MYARNSVYTAPGPWCTSKIADIIYGSNYVGSDYIDILFGENGDDEIHGRADRDYIDGGAGDDFIEGNAGNDVIVGGCGADDLLGLDGNDTICDSNGLNLVSRPECSCNSDGDDFMDGGQGRDTLWYTKNTLQCPNGTLDTTTTCGSHADDSFGDTTHWSQPLLCEVYSSNPADCSFP